MVNMVYLIRNNIYIIDEVQNTIAIQYTKTAISNNIQYFGNSLEIKLWNYGRISNLSLV